MLTSCLPTYTVPGEAWEQENGTSPQHPMELCALTSTEKEALVSGKVKGKCALVEGACFLSFSQ